MWIKQKIWNFLSTDYIKRTVRGLEKEKETSSHFCKSVNDIYGKWKYVWTHAIHVGFVRAFVDLIEILMWRQLINAYGYGEM